MTPEQKQRIAQIQGRRSDMDQFGPLSVGSTPGSHRSFVIVKGDVGLEANCGVAGERNNVKAEFFANAPADIDFLLSLVKSQETEFALCRQVQKRGEHSSSTCPCVVAVESAIREDGAGSMRSACVEKVKAMRDEWQAQADARRDPDNPHEYKGSYGLAVGAVDACDDIVTALESVSIQEQEGKQL